VLEYKALLLMETSFLKAMEVEGKRLQKQDMDQVLEAKKARLEEAEET